MFSSFTYLITKLLLLELYPAYNCYKIVKARNQEQLIPSLVFWITATAFLVVEYFADILLFWIPFYVEVKLIVLLWLTLPQTKGALVLYADVIEPFLHKHESRIDKSIADFQVTAKQTISHYGRKLVQCLRQMISQFVNKSLNTEAQASSNDSDAVAMKSESTIEPGWMSWVPIGALSSLVSRGTQLSEQFKYVSQSERETADDAHQVPPPVEEIGSDRSESYDSLNSLVLPKKSAPTSSSKATPSNSNVSWGTYLRSFVWQTPSEPSDSEKKKAE